MIDNSSFVKQVEGKKIRSQKWYTRFLRGMSFIFPCKFNDNGKEKRDYTYLTISKKRGLDMVAASLYSLYKNSKYLPSKVVIVSDGSWEPVYGVRYFAKRGLSVECIKWDVCADYYKGNIPDLQIWASKHIWGKKMAAILYVSEKYNTLFSDPDVLWYGTPLRDDEWDNTPVKVSIDCCHSYDKKYITSSSSFELNETEEPVNCGVVYICGGSSLLSKQAHECISYEALHCGDFAEQTVFAIMDQQYNNRWSASEVISSIDDVVNPFFSKPILFDNTVARHYLWRLKWIYWTEYWKMRFKKSQ